MPVNIADFVNQNFRGPNLPQIDQARRQNALGQIDLQQAQQQQALMNNPGATPEQLVRGGLPQQAAGLQNIAASEQQRKAQSAMQFSQRISAVAQSQRPKQLFSMILADPSTHQIVGDLGLSMDEIGQFVNSSDDATIKQTAMELAKAFGAKDQFHTVSKDQNVFDSNWNQVASGPADTDAQARLARETARDAEVARHNKVMEGFGRPSGTPNGYEADPANPGGLRPIVGGPADPSGGAGQGSRAELMFNRVVSAANEASAALNNISELPITASTGLFGTASAGTGLMSSAKSVLAQKMTSQEAQDTKVMFAGVARALGAIETSGLQVNGSLIHSMESITFNEGDTQMTKLRKMAEVRQIVEKGLEPNLSNPKIPPQQKALVNNIIADIRKAVPYTHHDITQLQYSKNPAATISDFAKSSGVQAAGALPSGVTEDDITETMRANGMTRDQVLQRLNAR